jgi:DNA-binding response OmpR family regulator
MDSEGSTQMHAATPREGAPESRPIPPDFQIRTVPNRVEVAATAATEDEALAACDRHSISLAIVDLQLAQGTGFGVIRRLRAATGANPACIVVLTNHAVPALKVAAFEAGADYFLDKSKDFATIPRLVGELLNSKKN